MGSTELLFTTESAVQVRELVPLVGVTLNTSSRRSSQSGQTQTLFALSSSLSWGVGEYELQWFRHSLQEQFKALFTMLVAMCI